MQRTESANGKIVQRINRLRVLDMIRSDDHVARGAICECTGLSPASVSNIVSYLIEAGLVEESGLENVSRTGRKSVLLSFTGDTYRLITISHTEKMLHIYLTDLKGDVYGHMEYRLQDLDPDATTGFLCGGIREMLNSPQGRHVIGVGISLSAMVLDQGRQVVSSTLQWDAPEIRRRLLEISDVPVHISNSSFTKGLWLCRTEGDGDRSLTLFVDITKGMGAALIRNSQRIPDVIGEIGHTTVARNGDECSCGNVGCLEAMCAPGRMLRLYNESANAGLKDFQVFSSLVESGDPHALSAMEDCAEYLGIGLANLVSLFNPDSMVINAADYVSCPSIIQKAVEVMQKRILPGLARRMAIRTVQFNEPDLPRAMAWELCGAIFSEQFPEDVFERIERMRLGGENV
ncbi:MAG: ROK family transcriptional regulator [Clostridia bacterium]|nr:ROK family transcriptional regulator [Clostridia bacterium]